MRIGIDISQVVYEGTGVSEYTKRLVQALLKHDSDNEYVLFFSSLRRKFPKSKFQISNRKIKFCIYPFPPLLLDLIWNRLGIIPIEWLTGPLDVFISSDWTQPPANKAKLVTIVHDLSPLKFPSEHHQKIVNVHKRRLNKVKQFCHVIICDSKATKHDLIQLLGVKETKIKVIYPGGKV